MIEGSYLGKVTQLRRSLHAAPELAYQEHETAKTVCNWLKACNLEVFSGIGGTGVVGVLRRGSSGRAIGLRADMDALPLQEATDLAHRSAVPGRMHACGHDGHVAMLLGAAGVLSTEGGFHGTVHFVFQPAEEGGAGAKRMIEDGLFKRFDMQSVYSLHNWPDLPKGVIALRPGPVMGASFRFRVVVTGRGAHAATPHQGIDPIPVVCATVQALQTVVARECSASDSVVISVTQLGGGEALNVVPQTAWFAGTARVSSPATEARVREALRRTAAAIAQAHGATAAVEVHAGYPATVNSPAETRNCIEAAERVFGVDGVRADVPVCLTTEDFGYMLAEKPGAYALLGGGGREGAPGLHNPHYDFNDEILSLGIRYWVELTRSVLKESK